jgi:hypothetical protein
MWQVASRSISLNSPPTRTMLRGLMSAWITPLLCMCCYNYNNSNNVNKYYHYTTQVTRFEKICFIFSKFFPAHLSCFKDTKRLRSASGITKCIQNLLLILVLLFYLNKTCVLRQTWKDLFVFPTTQSYSLHYIIIIRT